MQTIAELFKFMDTDNSGSIDKLEWLAGYHEYARLAADGGTAGEAKARENRPSEWHCKVMLSWHENKPLTAYMQKEPKLDLKALGLPTREKVVEAIGAILGHAEAEVAALMDAIPQDVIRPA